MTKLKIHSYLKVGTDFETIIDEHYHGKKEENKILYKEGNIAVCLLLEEKKVTMYRETEDYKIELPFVNQQILDGKYTIYELKDMLKLKVKTDLLVKTENQIKAYYHLDIDGEEIGNYEFILDYEVIE